MTPSIRRRIALEYGAMVQKMDGKTAAAMLRGKYDPGCHLESFRVKVYKWRKRFGLNTKRLQKVTR